MTQKWEIRYYMNESAYKCGCYTYKEIITADRYTVVSIAQNRIKYSNYKYYDIQQIQ